MKQVTILPSNLATLTELAELNRSLRSGQTSLDWSAVEQAEALQLEELLAGLSLNDEAVLGLDSVPDNLAKAVMGAMRRNNNAQNSRRIINDAASSNTATNKSVKMSDTPSEWLPPVSPVSGTDETKAGSTEANDLADITTQNAAVEAATSLKTNQAGDTGEVETVAAKESKESVTVEEGGVNTETILKPLSAWSVRAELEELVLKDLLGPAGGLEEELKEKVRDRYLIGMLAPGKLQADPDPDEHLDLAEQEELGSAENSRSGEDGSSDGVSQQQINFCPSSLGLSFSVVGTASQLKITARWGHYQRIYSETSFSKKGSPELVWKRSQRQGTITITLKENKTLVWQPEPDEQPGVIVRGIVRRRANNKSEWTITLFLVNGQNEPSKNRDSAWLFQPELTVEAPDGAAIFQRRTPERNGISGNPDRDEQEAMEMLYRKRVNFATGHGVSVHADTMPDNSTAAFRLTTRVAPSYELPRTDHLSPEAMPEQLSGLVLEMATLATLEGDALEAALIPLCKSYKVWIDAQRARLAVEPDLKNYRHVALTALASCENTLVRIEAGLSLVTSNEQAAKAFRFMNEAMHRQFVQSRLAEAKRQGQILKASQVEAPVWRPFQIAFILLNLPGLTDLSHPDRSGDSGAVADLLWFPTGGGKTEAYLGLTAFTLAIRRLQGTVGGRDGQQGVAVIMRYTLRLLTLQQFQRAATLMCACETLRREAKLLGDESWGSTPFRLGLWVGQRATPNTTSASQEALASQDEGWRGSVVGGSGTPKQLNNCPWCGHEIKVIVEPFARGAGRTLMYCRDPFGKCPFSERNALGEGLPVVVVDEEIYRLLPALLIATVDKFAQMPWKGATGLLFGQVGKKCERHGFVYADPPGGSEEPNFHPAKPGLPSAKVVDHPPLRPPDLIIQDELHLISGPLGTLVGLYESVVDHLCSWELTENSGEAIKTIRPKVVAATATIRRAERQIHALFLRQVNIFPPPVLDIDDNFFSHQVSPDIEKPGRLYLGICASGRRLKAALIRVYVAYLAAGQHLYQKYGAAVDPYMTLVGYFNSLSELGGTRRLVDDDVRSRLLRMDERGLTSRKSLLVEELTSRRSSVDIPRLLDQLERKFEGKFSHSNVTNDTYVNRPLDVLLATNMISVGVDVQRLGLMIVTGQPKNTAEYIQATSRVGRRFPGLVCVVYNWARPRDLSHYEQFEHYHATYYQYVEALSVTPFAARALDRGLSALLVSYVRLTGTEYNENSKAGDFLPSNPNYTLALDELGKRAEQVKNPAASQLVKIRLGELQEEWVAQTQVKGRKLGYKDESSNVMGLLEQPGRGEWKPFTCLNSLRDVEPTVKLILDDRPISTVTFREGSEAVIDTDNDDKN